jgi:hypothetical protein
VTQPLGSADVKIRNLRFYISGTDLDSITSDDFVPKVLVSFEIGIAASRGLNAAFSIPSYIRVETVVSEKPYKSS